MLVVEVNLYEADLPAKEKAPPAQARVPGENEYARGTESAPAPEEARKKGAYGLKGALPSLKSRTDFLRAFKKGSAARGEFFRIHLLGQDRPRSRLGIVVSGKVSNAVRRNRTRRRLRHIFREIFPALGGTFDAVVYVTKDPSDVPYGRLKRIVATLLRQAGVTGGPDGEEIAGCDD